MALGGILTVGLLVLPPLATFQLLTGLMPGFVFSVSQILDADRGALLSAVACSQSGEALYRDYAWQYGPLSIGWYRFFADAFGNTPMTQLFASTVAFGIGWGLLTFQWMRVLGRWKGWLAAIILLFPVMLPPLMITNHHGPHGSIEGLLFGLLTWQLSGAKSRWQSVGVGLTLGLFQWVRFGPHLACGLVVAIIWLAEERHEQGSFKLAWRSWRQRLLGVALAYLAMLAPLAGWFFCALPWQGALESLWPRYMTAHYVEGGHAHLPPVLERWHEGVAYALPALVLVPIAVAVATHPRVFARLRAAAPLLLLPLVFAVSSLVLYRSLHNFFAHAWLPLAGAPLLWLLLNSEARRGALALAALFAMTWAGFFGAAATREHLRSGIALPNGDILWGTATERAEVGNLRAAISKIPPRDDGQAPIVATLMHSTGICHFLCVRRPTRTIWVLPEFVRPWEEDTAARGFQHADAFLFLEDPDPLRVPKPPPSLQRDTVWFPLSPSLRARVLPSVGHVFAVPGYGYFALNANRERP